MVAQVRYSVEERSGGRVTLCAVCTIHVLIRSTCFLVEPQNQGRRFVSSLALKPLGQFLLVWPQNRWRRSQFGLKTGGDGFFQFGLKTGGDGFSGLSLKTGSYGFVIWASKSP
jgi:hypothetical protein